MRKLAKLCSCHTALVFAYVACAACADSAGTKGGDGGVTGRGGAAGRAATGGDGGREASTGGSTAMLCNEPAPTQPVVCGGETCTAPTDFTTNPCVVPCCIELGGIARCGAKSTSPDFPADCTLPALPYPSCPSAYNEMLEQTYPGCCNVEQGKCGVISTVRPGCITKSLVTPLPDPPKACTGSADGGRAEAGL